MPRPDSDVDVIEHVASCDEAPHTADSDYEPGAAEYTLLGAERGLANRRKCRKSRRNGGECRGGSSGLGQNPSIPHSCNWEALITSMTRARKSVQIFSLDPGLVRVAQQFEPSVVAGVVEALVLEAVLYDPPYGEHAAVALMDSLSPDPSAKWAHA